MRIDRKSERHLATRKVAVYTVRAVEITSDAGGSTEQITRHESTNVVCNSLCRAQFRNALEVARYRMLPLTCYKTFQNSCNGLNFKWERITRCFLISRLGISIIENFSRLITERCKIYAFDRF